MANRQASLLLLLCSLAASVPALAGTYARHLPNGLQVIVKEDRRAPTAVHMVWYRAGSMDETSGRTGVAHVLEHMMFKGTPDVGAGEFSRRVAAAGGRDNAFTSRDYTAYFQQVPKHQLGEMMRLEADRMRHLTLEPKEFAQELRVVMEERRLRTDDQASSLLFEQLLAAAFQVHPYRAPIIGWMTDLEHLLPDDARRWYDDWYAPNNAYVVVVGNVDHQAVFALAEQHYGRLPARALPLRKPQDEPPQRGLRRLRVKAPADLPLLMMAYKVPVIRDVERDVDPYALEMLAAVLAGHDAARLSTELVRRQRLAVEAGASYDVTARGPGLFYLHAAPAPGRSVAELEAGLRAELVAVQENGVSEDELTRAKAQLIAGQIFKLDSMFAQAMEIGQIEAAGIAHTLQQRLIEKRQAVTVEQLRGVARRYFDDRQLTVAELDPQPLSSPSSADLVSTPASTTR